MSNIKISQLPEITSTNPNDELPIISSGQSKKIKVSNLVTSGGSGSNGTSGTSGSNGSSGTSGQNGSSGSSGSNGSSGTSGNGTSGTSGSNGSNGSSGTSGVGGYLKMTQLLDNVGTTTRTGQAIITEWTTTYTSQSGSTCLFEVIFSAFATSAAGTRQFDLLIDGSVVKSTSLYFNETLSHKFVPMVTAETLSAGSHTIQIRIPANTQVDIGDFASITVTETMSNGINGTSGTSGTSGSNGSSGTSGSSGSSGSSGTSVLTTVTGTTSTGNLNVGGSLNTTGSATLGGGVLVSASAGAEGGEIDLAYSQTTTLTGSYVALDVYNDRVRIFEGGGSSRGVYVDLSKAPGGVGGELLWKSSGYVNAGTFVSLDNVKATVTTSGNRGLSIGAVSTSFTGSTFSTIGYSGGGGGMSNSGVVYTTTASSSVHGWGFGAAGDGATYILNDTTNSRVYRITMMIGPGYNNNFISIERLY